MFANIDVTASIERSLQLPEVVVNSFKKAKRRFPWRVWEKLAPFVPLLTFPLISLSNPITTILFLFFVLLISDKKSNLDQLTEQGVFLSLSYYHPQLIPFCFLWILASFVLMQQQSQIANPLHRFLYIACTVTYPPSIILLAPIYLLLVLVLSFKHCVKED
jgi:hypothetical protein